MAVEPGGRPWFSGELQRKWDEAQKNNSASFDGEDVITLMVALFNLAFVIAVLSIFAAAYNALFYAVYGVKVYAIVPAAFALVGSAFLYESIGSRKPTKWLAWAMLIVSIVWALYKSLWDHGSTIETVVSVLGAIASISVALRRLKQVYGLS